VLTTTPDRASRFCAARCTTFMTSQNLLTECLRWDRNGL